MLEIEASLALECGVMRATGILMHRLDFNLFSLLFGRGNILMMGSFIGCFHMSCEIENQLTTIQLITDAALKKNTAELLSNTQHPATLYDLN